MDENKVSRKTIIYSVRVGKGKVVAQQQFELGELLDKLDAENKLKEDNSLKELKGLFEQQIKVFLAKISEIDQNLKEVRTTIIEKHGTTAKVLKYFDDLDKERR